MIAVAAVPRVNSATGSAIAVNPGFVHQIVGSSFSVDITLANVVNLTGFDVIVTYNQAVLNAVHVSKGNWNDGVQAFTLANETTNALGTIHVSQVLLGGTVNIVNSTLFTISYTFIGAGTSPITLSSVLLSGVVSGQVVLLPTPTIVNGVASTPPPATASLIQWKAKPDFKHLTISHSGTVQTLFANIANTGTNPAFVRVDFIVTSAAGSVTVVETVPVVLTVGGSAIVSIAYTVPLLPMKYFVDARLSVSGDGVLYTFSGSSKTFAYSVVP